MRSLSPSHLPVQAKWRSGTPTRGALHGSLILAAHRTTLQGRDPLSVFRQRISATLEQGHDDIWTGSATEGS